MGDLILLGLASWIVFRLPPPVGAVPLLLVVVSVAAAAWLAVTPFLIEYRTAVKFAEAGELTTVVAQIEQLGAIGEQVRLATAQWQSVQEHCGKTVGTAKEIMERMADEAQAFADFRQKANDSEKGHLRLEVEKLRRGEGEWLQVVVRMLDHVYALTLAGARSGQPALREQLGRFQFACYDAARRVGLVPTEARTGEVFQADAHQLSNAQEAPPAGAVIADTLATGYSYQGQVLRLPVVSLAAPELATPPGEESAEPEAVSEPSAIEAGLTSMDEQTPPLDEEEFRLEAER